MTGTFVVSGDETTITFEYVANTTKVVNSLNDAVHYLYPAIFGEVLDAEGGVIPFEELTNQQKLGVLDAWVRKTILDLARQYDRKRILEESVAEAALLADDKYI